MTHEQAEDAAALRDELKYLHGERDNLNRDIGEREKLLAALETSK